MQAQELRLGNKVMRYGKIVDVVEIGERHAYVSYKIIPTDKIPQVLSISPWDIEGVPLTPELLEKCGFEVYDDFDNHSVYYYKKDSIRLQMSNYEGHECYVVLYDEDAKQYSYQIKYLHQLQNLFFALTGAELTINP